MEKSKANYIFCKYVAAISSLILLLYIGAEIDFFEGSTEALAIVFYNILLLLSVYYGYKSLRQLLKLKTIQIVCFIVFFIINLMILLLTVVGYIVGIFHLS